jgi:hypothetical protein
MGEDVEGVGRKLIKQAIREITLKDSGKAWQLLHILGVSARVEQNTSLMLLRNFAAWDNLLTEYCLWVGPCAYMLDNPF